MKPIEESLQFDNRFVSQLPADPVKVNGTRQVEQACYSFVDPTPVKKPSLVAFSEAVAQSLGLSNEQVRSKTFSEIFVGNRLIEGMQPFAMCYGGHQFGHWAGQLGDGRAINLGEVLDTEGNHQTLQLKGAGPTPYSRSADGLAVLRSSVREFLCSEAMHHLGIPTTRALSLVLTGEQVMRDMFYDGHPALEPGAVVCRVSPSFIRFGNFEIFSARNDHDNLKRLMDFCIQNDFPHLLEAAKGDPSATYEAWFQEVCQRSLEMAIHWMRVGFVHGVMNTDNMSILGLTIDYGPYGWLEGYDPRWTPNTTDSQGKRYSYANQPQIVQWNLYKLANAIAPIVGRTENLEASLHQFGDDYNQKSHQMYLSKLGLKAEHTDSDKTFVESLFEMLFLTETDMTIFFRRLSRISGNENYTTEEIQAFMQPCYYKPDQVSAEMVKKTEHWFRRYLHRLSHQDRSDEDRKLQMDRTNPKYVLRNYLAQQAIDLATQGDFSEINQLLQVLKLPYDEQPEFERYFARRPEWARAKAGCSMLSCSS